jgi:anti-anti-sigma factor
MEIAETTKGAVRVLKPKGPLSLADAEQFKRAASEAAGAAMGRLVIDVSGVPFVDSRGLEVLVELGEALGESGQTLKLCSVNETLREVFDLTEVSAALEQFEDVNAAVRSFL